VHRFAVVGNPVAHSLSPQIHQCFAAQCNVQLTYEKIKGDGSQFEQQVSDFFAANGKGLNITLPFKQRAFSLAQSTTERCQIAGAANTLWIDNNTLQADNTDGIGFIRDISGYLNLVGKKVLILGAGGAVRGIVGPLLKANLASLTVANRTLTNAQQLKQDFPLIQCCELTQINAAFDLVINATAASLEGKSLALPPAFKSHKPFCYDLAYKADEDTHFVRDAKLLGCNAVDGLGMLVEQAAEAFYLWHGIRPEVKPVLDQLRGD